MAIKGKKSAEVVSVFDPAKGAYHEVSVEELEKQLVALGFSKDEIDAKVNALQAQREE
jgi:Holliday junction resolvasome RuvABC DNA-binding subunit